jgi:hypothetical protein
MIRYYYYYYYHYYYYYLILLLLLLTFYKQPWFEILNMMSYVKSFLCTFVIIMPLINKFTQRVVREVLLLHM